MYKVDSRKLKELVRNQGEGGLAKTSLGSLVSVSTLQKMIAGQYNSSPGKAMRLRLANFFNVPENELFPPATTGKRRSA